MEQEKRQNQPQQPQAPLQCPRCHSMNTKFRYFNNLNTSQPRYYCRDCRRMWTVGGSLRNITVGGTTRNRQKGASSRRVDSSSQPQPTELPTYPQNFDSMGNQLFTNFQRPIAPLHSFYFNEFTNLDAVDSLIQSEVINQAVNVKNQVGFDSSNVNLMQEWNDWCFGPKQGLSQQIQGYNDQSNVVDLGFAKLSQISDEAGSSYNPPNRDLVRSTWPVNITPPEAMNNFSLSTTHCPEVKWLVPRSVATRPEGEKRTRFRNKTANCLWDNFSTNKTKDLLSTSADPNQWIQFPGCGPV